MLLHVYSKLVVLRLIPVDSFFLGQDFVIQTVSIRHVLFSLVSKATNVNPRVPHNKVLTELQSWSI